MKIHSICIFVCCLVPFPGLGQAKNSSLNDSTHYQYYIKKDLTFITGYQIQNKHFAEIGIGVIKDGVIGYHPSTLIYGISNEIRISDDFVWGLKTGLWMGGGMNLGLNLIHYTDFSDSSLRFRPEIGLGLGVFRIVYGYNFTLTNKEFSGINKHNFGLNIMLKVKSLGEKKYNMK
ncbi:MAG: hypothetical protein ACI81T_002362 [Bacteroidia bacterium]|jgi:hypothetical protein